MGLGLKFRRPGCHCFVMTVSNDMLLCGVSGWSCLGPPPVCSWHRERFAVVFSIGSGGRVHWQLKVDAGATLQPCQCWHSCRIYCDLLHASLHVSVACPMYLYSLYSKHSSGTEAELFVAKKVCTRRAVTEKSVNVSLGA